MEDKSQKLIHKIQQLIDLELVCLLCFVADQHCCIIETQEGDLKNVQKTLALVSRIWHGNSYRTNIKSDMRRYF